MKLNNYILQKVEREGISCVYYYKHIENGNTVLIGRCDKSFLKDSSSAETTKVSKGQGDKLSIEVGFGKVELELNKNESVKIKTGDDFVHISRNREDIFYRKVKEFRSRMTEPRKTLIDKLLGK